MGIGFPLLMRPLAKHGGNGLTLHDAVDALWPALDAYSAPFACHITTSSQWSSTTLALK
jgi:hypothetical protein